MSATRRKTAISLGITATLTVGRMLGLAVGPSRTIRALAALMAPDELISMGDPAFDYRRLPVAERLKLIDDIWDSIAQDATADTLPVSDADKALLDQRLAELERNPDAGADWPEVRARILSRFKK